MSLIAEFKRRNDRLRSLSSVGSIDGGEGLKHGNGTSLADGRGTL